MTERNDAPHRRVAVVTNRAMTVSEAARRWNVSRTTARKRLDQGRLPDHAGPLEMTVVPGDGCPIEIIDREDAA
jgi:hypothetical protein